MKAAGKIAGNIGIWVLMLALCFGSWAAADAYAADDSGLEVEQVYLREILRAYAADPAGFDADNGPQALAELFTATVGLNYYGEGNPASYFAKDITAKYDQEPYVAANLVASYDVPIHPVNGRAEASPDKTWKIHVYLTGYTAEAVGAVPVYHYVWQDNGSWWGVRDLAPYYRVSYNGTGAAVSSIGWLRSGDVSTGRLNGWSNLAADTGAAIANGSTASYVAAEGSSAIFAALDGSGEPVAISDYVRGSAAAGPVLRSKTVTAADGHVLSSGEEMLPGQSYRVKLVYRDGLKTAQRGSTVSVSVLRADGTACGSVTDAVWYGAEEYLPLDAYNPETVEFSVTLDSQCDWCLLAVKGVVGFETGLAPAAVWQNAYCDAVPVEVPAATAVPTETPAPTPETVVTPEPVAEPAAVAEPTAAPTAEPTPEVTPEPTPEPTAEPLPAVLTFSPDALVTWGDLCLRLWDAQGRVDVVNDPAQTDLYRASCWVSSIGLLANWGEGSLTPEMALTREQMAYVLHAYAVYLGRDVSAADDLTLRPDGASVSPWTVAAVQWAVGSGVLSPAMDGSVAPGATVSHGQLDWMLSIL